MRLLLTQAGFRDVRIATHAVNVLELIHHFRRGRKTTATSGNGEEPAESFDRVGSGYKLNERLTTNGAGQVVKYCGNAVVSLSKVGDSLKIRGIR